MTFLTDSGAGAIPMPEGHSVARIQADPSDPLGEDKITCRCGFIGKRAAYVAHGEQIAQQTRAPMVVPGEVVDTNALPRTGRTSETLRQLVVDLVVITERIERAANDANAMVLRERRQSILDGIEQCIVRMTSDTEKARVIVEAFDRSPAT